MGIWQDEKRMWRVVLALFLAAFTVLAADWPQFLGPSRDGVSPETITWPEAGPRELWRKPIGAGFSGVAVAGGRVFLFHRVGNEEVLAALEISTGDEVWKAEYPTSYRDSFGFDPGPRATPVVTAGKVVTFGAQGVLQVVDERSGKLLWRRQLHEDFGVAQGFFGAAGTPLVHENRVYLNVGGPKASLVCLALATGETLWTALSHEASYASPVAAEFDAETVIVFFTREGLVGAAPDTGEVLFERRWRAISRASVNAATPLVDGSQIFVSASYGTGALLSEFASGELGEVWSGEEALTNHYSTSVRSGEFLFGFHGRQEYGQELRCIEWDTGKVRWTEKDFGAGSILRAGPKLVVVTEVGEVALLDATADAYREIGRKKVLDGTVRAFPALADGVLYVRNGDTLVALGFSGG